MNIVRLIHRYVVRQTMPDVAAGYYDDFTQRVKELYLQPFCDELLRRQPRPRRILDIGTGNGLLPVMLTKADAGVRVVGIDLSRKFLSIAARHAQEAAVGDRVRFERINIEKDNWLVEPFDLIVSTWSLHHWRHAERIVQAAAKVLKPDGQILLLDDAAEATNQQRRDWVRAVQQATGPRRLFELTYRFESRFLAYSRPELESLAAAVGLRLAGWRLLQTPFFIATIAR